MGNKALGRDLGDLLSRARPSRLVDKVSPSLRGPAPAVGATAPQETGDLLAPVLPFAAEMAPATEPPPAAPRAKADSGRRLVCFTIDALFLIAAVFLVRTDLLPFPWGLVGALVCTAVGLGFGLAGVLPFRPRHPRTPRIGESESRIRVQLKR